MEDLAAPTPRQRLLSPRAPVAVAAGLVVAAAVCGGIWRFSVKPAVEASVKIHAATMDMWALYDLQMARKRSVGVYANGLDALLATTKDGPALKARMAGYIDLNTAAVVGDADKFKVELNVLDEKRTLLKIKGPIGERLWTGKVAAPLPEASSSSDGLGAPVGR